MNDEGNVWEGRATIPVPYGLPTQPILPRKFEKTISPADLEYPFLDDVVRRVLEEQRIARNYTPKQIIHNRDAVIVFWKDGSKTIVRRREGDPDDIHSAFAQALTKKLFGATTTVHKMVDKVLKEQEPKKRKEG